MSKTHYLLPLLLITSCSTPSSSIKRLPAGEVLNASAIPAAVPLKKLDPKNWSCTRMKQIHDSSLAVCEATTENTAPTQKAKMNVLSLKGNFVSNSYDHGYLLGPEIETGSLIEALDNFKKMDSELPQKLVGIAHQLISCYQHKIEKSLDEEFKSGVKELHHGYSDRMIADQKPVKFSVQDIEAATYGIEVGNVFYSLLYQAGAHPARAVGHVLRDCAISVSQQSLTQLWERIFRRDLLKHKLACSGAILPQTITKDGHFYHARNLEQTGMIESWNRNPVTFIVEEKNYHKYVAFGTAGLIFPGGISGYNDQGIAVSTHQMDPAKYSVSFKKGSAALGPYLQQRILREASTLDEALKIAKSTHTFAAWTFLTSDSKTQKAISIEITKDGALLGATSTETGLAQSNHFDHPSNSDMIFHDSYNFYLETLGRHQMIDLVLKSHYQPGKPGTMSFDDLLSLLSSHLDWQTGQNVSFGRSVARVMNIFSSVVSPDQNKVWVTLSDRMPSNHGYYLGLDVNFNEMKLTPFEVVREADQDSKPNYLNALSLYQRAYRAKNAGDSLTARKQLEEALVLAQKDGIDDLNFRIMIAHFFMKEEKYEEAYAHLKVLENRLSEMHPLQRALLRSFRIYALDQLDEKNTDFVQDSSLRASWYEDAKNILETAINTKKSTRDFPTDGSGLASAKKDLESRLKTLNRINEQSSKVKIPGVDMKTGE